MGLLDWVPGFDHNPHRRPTHRAAHAPGSRATGPGWIGRLFTGLLAAAGGPRLCPACAAPCRGAFCAVCGVPVNGPRSIRQAGQWADRVCPRCHASAPPATRYCAACGGLTRVQPGALAAARKAARAVHARTERGAAVAVAQPDTPAAPHITTARADGRVTPGISAAVRAADQPKKPVRVKAHTRDGEPVAAHTRNRPGEGESEAPSPDPREMARQRRRAAELAAQGYTATEVS